MVLSCLENKRLTAYTEEKHFLNNRTAAYQMLTLTDQKILHFQKYSCMRYETCDRNLAKLGNYSCLIKL